MARKNSVERAHHLIGVFKASVSSGLLICWLQIIVLDPLKTDEIDMEHMDPSDIVQVPFSLRRLNTFVLLPLVVVLLFQLFGNPNKFTSFLLSLTRFALILYALFALCGAHIVKDYQHSVLTALYTASLLTTTTSPDKMSVLSNVLDQIPLYDTSNIVASSQLYGMIFVTIQFQILQVLDWGIQLQRWPLPVILGVTYGYVIGSLIGMLLNYMKRRSAGRTD